MTCIAAIVDGNGVGHIACDSLGSDGYTKGVYVNQKIFSLGSMLIGFTGSYRQGQLLQYRLRLPAINVGQPVEDWLHLDFIDAVREVFSTNGVMHIEDNLERACPFLAVFGGRIFLIQGDLSILESTDPFQSVGSGEDYARATMNAAINHGVTDPREILAEAIEAAAKYVPSVGGDIYLLSESDI